MRKCFLWVKIQIQQKERLINFGIKKFKVRISCKKTLITVERQDTKLGENICITYHRWNANITNINEPLKIEGEKTRPNRGPVENLAEDLDRQFSQKTIKNSLNIWTDIHTYNRRNWS